MDRTQIPPNKLPAVEAAIALLFQDGQLGRGPTEADRWADVKSAR